MSFKTKDEGRGGEPDISSMQRGKGKEGGTQRSISPLTPVKREKKRKRCHPKEKRQDLSILPQ